MRMLSNTLFGDIINFSLQKQTWAEKTILLLKGFLYYPFLKQEIKEKTQTSSTHLHEAGEHIYPLF